VTFLIVAVLAWGLEYNLESDLLREVAENTAGQASNILDKNLTVADLRDSLTGDRYQQVDELIHSTLLSSNIVRIKIWNRNGLLVYADEPTIVGKSFPPSDELEEALAGHLTTEFSSLEEEENVAERGLYEQLFEIYVPLQLAGSDEILGVYEVYYDLSKLEPQLARVRFLVWGGMGTGFVLLYSVLFFLIRKASRDLIQRNAENQRLLAAEKKQREL